MNDISLCRHLKKPPPVYEEAQPSREAEDCCEPSYFINSAFAEHKLEGTSGQLPLNREHLRLADWGEAAAYASALFNAFCPFFENILPFVSKCGKSTGFSHAWLRL